MRGTMSHYIPMTFEFPCSLNLTFTAITDEEFTLIPEYVIISVGESEKYF